MRSAVPVPGSSVWIRQRRWRVERSRLDRGVVLLDVASRNDRLTFLAPFDRPVLESRRTRPVRCGVRKARARLAQLAANSAGRDTIVAAVAARMDLWPHQFEPALAMLQGHRRVLIADEVGLGKTIQAGLLLAELHRRLPTFRALVIAPAALRAQWMGELRERFGLSSLPAEHETLAATSRTGAAGASPWQHPGIWVASADYVKQPHVLDNMPLSAWDVVVIDEAHTASGRSGRHEACDELGKRARHLLLLSATPHSGDDARFARVMRLGSLPATHDELVVFRRTRREVGLPSNRAVRWHGIPCPNATTRLLDALVAFEHAVLRQARPGRRDAALLLLSIFRKRALSTLHALDRSLTRRLEWLDSPERAYDFDWLQPRLNFDDNDDDLADEERSSLMADVGVPVNQERTWLRRLRTLIEAHRGGDPKARRLTALLTRTSEPVVIFTEFVHSLEYLQTCLGVARQVAVLHGGQSEKGRADELNRFRNGVATVLIATDVGGQGLNLQATSRWVINLELPWNPVRLEQRIGRVDRIGQRRRVHATLLLARHPTEFVVLSSLARRTLAARRSLGSSVLEDFSPPPTLAVAAALLDQTPLPSTTHSAAAPRPPICTAWRRRARAMSRHIAGKRTLALHWRAPSTPHGRPVHAAGSALKGLLLNGDGLLVYSVAVLDRSGDVVERRLVALRTPDATPAFSTEVGVAFERIAHAALAARLRRVRRLAESAGARRIASERAIALHLHALRRPEEAQLGMFSQREARIFDLARAAAALSAEDATARMQLEHDGMQLSLGRPALEWMWWPR